MLQKLLEPLGRYGIFDQVDEFGCWGVVLGMFLDADDRRIASERPFVARPPALRYVQCICLIMGGDGAELRCSLAYVLGHGFPSLASGRASRVCRPGSSADPVLVLGGLLEDMVGAHPSKVS